MKKIIAFIFFFSLGLALIAEPVLKRVPGRNTSRELTELTFSQTPKGLEFRKMWTQELERELKLWGVKFDHKNDGHVKWALGCLEYNPEVFLEKKDYQNSYWDAGSQKMAKTVARETTEKYFPCFVFKSGKFSKPLFFADCGNVIFVKGKKEVDTTTTPTPTPVPAPISVPAPAPVPTPAPARTGGNTYITNNFFGSGQPRSCEQEVVNQQPSQGRSWQEDIRGYYPEPQYQYPQPQYHATGSGGRVTPPSHPAQSGGGRVTPPSHPVQGGGKVTSPSHR